MRALLATVPLFTLVLGCGESNNEPRAPNVFDEAYHLCDAMKGTGDVTECTVDGSGHFVDVRIDMSSEEAKKVCAATVAMVAQHTTRFAGIWQLRLFSPYSGDHPIAICTLY